MPLLQLDIQASPPPEAQPQRNLSPRKGFLIYMPLLVAVLLILLPHPSFVIMLTSYYLKTLHAPITFWSHLLAVDILTFLAFTSLMACVVRDPGSISPPQHPKSHWATAERDEQSAALLQQEDDDHDDGAAHAGTFDGRWCRTCMHARPERAHHCSTCGRCVLKMDHHCPWLGGNCVGYRTYPSFMHFLGSTTLLATYITGVALSVVIRLVSDPFSIDPHTTPLHALFLVLMGAIFTLTMGSFLAYHIYLTLTNQTTLEHMSPFLLLRHLPAPPAPARHPPPPSSPRPRPKIITALADPPTPDPDSPLSPPTMSMSPLRTHPPAPLPLALHPHPPYRDDFPYRPPEEHELSPAQRRVVQHAHARLRLYDLGPARNWRQVFGGGRRGWRGWADVLAWGGAPRGDGRAWERARGAREGLVRLAGQLEDVRRQER